jgi:hypothetical protein
MDFHADDDLPITGRTFDQFLSIGSNVHVTAHFIPEGVSSTSGSGSSDARQV